MIEVEEGKTLSLDFEKTRKAADAGAVLPVIVQDAKTKDVLILGYVNDAALKQSIETGFVTFFSTSRKEIWVKGDTSGNRLRLKEIRVNCEQNSLLFLAELEGQGACHTKEKDKYRYSCYYRRLEQGTLKFV